MTLVLAKKLLAEAPPGLSRPARMVLRNIATKAQATGHLKWPMGDKQLVRETDYSLSSVRRGRRELVRAGLLEATFVGTGRTRSSYALPQLFRAEQLEAAVGFGDPFEGVQDEHPGCSGRPPRVVTLTTPTRARPLSFQGSTSLTQEGKGPEEDADGLRPAEELPPSPGGAGATKCPRATSRGVPCASCRACGTNPRAQRAQVAAVQRRGTIGGVPALTDPEQVARNQRGVASARDAVAAAKSKSEGRSAPSHDQGGAAQDAGLSTSAGAP